MSSTLIYSRLTLATSDAQRIIKRLAKHWQHKFEIVEDDNNTIIPFSSDNKATLSHDDNHLFVLLETIDTETRDKLQQVIVSHINRMAQQEFEAEWHNNFRRNADTNINA